MLDALFGRRYTARILAFEYIDELFGKLDMALFYDFVIAYNIDGDIRAYKT